MEALERRALVMLVVVALLLLRATGLFPTQTWLVAVYIFAPAVYVGRWTQNGRGSCSLRSR